MSVAGVTSVCHAAFSTAAQLPNSCLVVPSWHAITNMSTPCTPAGAPSNAGSVHGFAVLLEPMVTDHGVAAAADGDATSPICTDATMLDDCWLGSRMRDTAQQAHKVGEVVTSKTHTHTHTHTRKSKQPPWKHATVVHAR